MSYSMLLEVRRFADQYGVPIETPYFITLGAQSSGKTFFIEAVTKVQISPTDVP